MDEAFLQELDMSMSNIGTDVCWQRTIDGRIIWFAPLTLTSQMKLNETITNEELGSNIFSETKKFTLAHSIVGVDKMDLRKFRNGALVFPITNREGQVVKVSLQTYMYEKVSSWGAEWVDIAIDVFGDLMTSYRKESVKDVKFENAKDPMTELAELEARVAEIRSSMKMPPLVEARDKDLEEDMEDELPKGRKRAPVVQEPDEDQEPPERQEVAFNPFETTEPVLQPHPQTTVAVPIPKPPSPTVMEKAAMAAALEADIPIGKSPARPHVATPSVPTDVVERPEAGPTGESAVAPKPLQVDRVAPQSVNPRFAGRMR